MAIHGVSSCSETRGLMSYSCGGAAGPCELPLISHCVVVLCGLWTDSGSKWCSIIQASTLLLMSEESLAAAWLELGQDGEYAR